jgi:hypothetical protein
MAALHNSIGNPERYSRLLDNAETDLKEIGCQVVCWINPAQNREKRGLLQTLDSIGASNSLIRLKM